MNPSYNKISNIFIVFLLKQMDIYCDFFFVSRHTLPDKGQFITKWSWISVTRKGYGLWASALYAVAGDSPKL